MSTIGRGLGIVALYSTTWGSHVAPEGKTVWFEPSTETEVDGDLSGEVFDLAAEVTVDLGLGAWLEPDGLALGCDVGPPGRGVQRDDAEPAPDRRHQMLVLSKVGLCLL